MLLTPFWYYSETFVYSGLKAGLERQYPGVKASVKNSSLLMKNVDVIV